MTEAEKYAETQRSHQLITKFESHHFGILFPISFSLSLTLVHTLFLATVRAVSVHISTQTYYNTIEISIAMMPKIDFPNGEMTPEMTMQFI